MHVDLAEPADHLIDHFLDTLFIAHVGVDRHGFRHFADFAGGLLSKLGIEIDDHDFGFFFGKRGGRMLADPLPAAGYHNDFILQHVLPPK